METNTLVSVLMAFCAIAAPIVAYLLYKLYNSPDGERYRKRSMQGPFVPLDAEEIAQDAARKATPKSKSPP
ncbi:MAG: hypothetical protein H7293_02900 [Candidatus Saccharibacteria bacterium]|nr:hypothetical protein [Rhodoferax sp.]